MAIKSQFDGKCRDCGKEYKKGDMIDTNSNQSPNKTGELKDHWCPDGENCKGAMKLEGGYNPSNGPQKQIVPSISVNEKLESLELNYNALPIEQKQHYGIFKLYLEHLKQCRDMGITNHIEAQMLFKAVIWRLKE